MAYTTKNAYVAGEILTDIGTMTNLKIFDISDNDFTQTFDPSWATWFDAMTALEEFDISDNNFSGTLVNTLCDVDFDYEGNSITHACY